VVPPQNTQYPVAIKVKLANAPRLFVLHYTQSPTDPWGEYRLHSMQNGNGPMWGSQLETIVPFKDTFDEEREVYGGVGHELSSEELAGTGLKRSQRKFYS
jgi:hypothetical protein